MTVEAVVNESFTGAIPRGDDLELRVRVLTVDGEKFTDIREYIVSNETYGRGVMVPFELTKTVMKALMDASRSG